MPRGRADRCPIQSPTTSRTQTPIRARRATRQPRQPAVRRSLGVPRGHIGTHAYSGRHEDRSPKAHDSFWCFSGIFTGHSIRRPPRRVRPMRRGTIGIALAAVGAVIFGATATLVGFVIDDIDPFRLASLRIAVAGLFLLPWAIAHRAAIWRAPVLVGLVGVLQIVLNGGLYVAIDRLGVGPAVGLQFLAPVLVVTWDRVAGHAHPRPITWAAVASAVIGVALLVQVGDLDGLDTVGLIGGLVAATGLAVYLRLSEHVGGIVGGFPLAAGAITIGGFVGFAVARPWNMPIPSDPVVIWLVVVLGTIGMAIPLSMEIAALSRVPARIIGVIITIEPVAAAVTAWMFLDQTLGASQIVGLILIVIAVGAVSLTASSGRPEPAVVAEAP